MLVPAPRPFVAGGRGATAVVALGGAGLGGVGVASALLLVLHALAPRPGPVHSMLSEFALGRYGPLFDTAVLVLAAGSGAVLAALRLSGLLPPRGAAAHLLRTWCVALLVLVAFPTGVGGAAPTPTAVVHAVASVAGFVALPLAALTLTRGRRGRLGAAKRVLAVLSLVLLVPVVGGLAPGSPWAVQEESGVPFGLIQRGLGVVEVALLVLLALAALRARRGGRRAAQA